MVDATPAYLKEVAEALRETCARFGLDAFVEVEFTKTASAFAGTDEEDDDDDDKE